MTRLVVWRGTGLVLAFAATLFLSSCGDPDSGKANNPPNEPEDQAAFIAAKVQVASDYDQAPNDIVKGQLYDSWRKTGSCAALKSPNFSNWTGTITSIQSGGGFIVDIGENVTLESYVDQSSQVFKTISGLREGDTVKISGTFTSDDPKCAAQVIAAPWGDSAVKSPDFNVKFSDVTPE